MSRRALGWLSPVATFLGATLMLCCLVTLPEVASDWTRLSFVEPRLAGWAGVAVMVAVGVAGLSLAGARRVGSAPPLALGATTALLGLALAGEVIARGQAVLALLLLAVGAGALFAFGLCVLEELPDGGSGLLLADLALIGWLLPVAGGWGALGWLAIEGRTPEAGLGLHPSVIALATTGCLLLIWVVVTLLLDVPASAPRGVGGRRWADAWAALAALVGLAGSLVLLVGFQPELSPSWGRPVVLLVAALAALGFGLCAAVIPEAAARPAYLVVVVSAATGPSCIHALLLVSADSEPLSGWVLVVVTLAGAAGVLLGWATSRVAGPLGLLVMAGAAVGGWVMPDGEWQVSAATAPLVLGVAMAFSGGIRTAAGDPVRLRFVAMSGLSALLLGLVAAAPIAWALGADLAGRDEVRAGGRVLLGLTFALCVMAAAAAYVLQTGFGAIVRETPGQAR